MDTHKKEDMSRHNVPQVDYGRQGYPSQRNKVNFSHDHYAHHEAPQEDYWESTITRKKQGIHNIHGKDKHRQEEDPESYSEEVHTGMFIPDKELWSEEQTKAYLKALYNNMQSIHLAKINELRKKQQKQPYENNAWYQRHQKSSMLRILQARP